jgi:hypothetical protein
MMSRKKRQRKSYRVANQLSENEFRDRFVEHAASPKGPEYLAGSEWCTEVDLFFDTSQSSPNKSTQLPDYRADAIEVDREDRLHLWEAKKLHKRDLLTGKVLGQLIFYDWLATTTSPDPLIRRMRDKGLSEESAQALRGSATPAFTTWNILVCGGGGWELGAMFNAIYWTYANVSEEYFQSEIPINVFQFYIVNGQPRLAMIWDQSLIYGEEMDPDSYALFFQETGIDREWWEESTRELRDGEMLDWYQRPDFPEHLLYRDGASFTRSPEAIVSRRQRQEIASLVESLIEKNGNSDFWNSMRSQEGLPEK